MFLDFPLVEITIKISFLFPRASKFLENTSSNPNVMNLSVGSSPLNDALNNTFDFGYSAHPTLYDIDSDNDLDLIVGEAIGNLNFLENIGDSLNFIFDLRNENFGGVDVSEWWTNIGGSAPVFYQNNNQIELFVGSKRGTIFKYNNIDNNLGGNFNLIDSNYQGLNLGSYSSPAVFDLNNDTLPDFIIGNKRGGLSYFKGTNDSTNISNTIHNKKVLNFKIFPNPSNNIIQIKNLDSSIKYEILSISGASIYRGTSNGILDIQYLSNGIYFLKLKSNFDEQIFKFVKWF